jgi:predicted Zn-dependent protease with MMP-like domain
VAVRRRGSQARRNPARRAPFRGPRASLFERAVEQAIDGLPGPLRALLEEVAIVIDDEPNAEQRRLNRLGLHDVLYGLYEGTPPTEYGADWVPWPNRITLFRLALVEDFPDPDDLVEEVRVTLVHELAHHAGFDDERLADLGMD